ncbi:hypothetical protein ACFQ21_05105 [Ohtaekwangia kribbensis]|uniref:Uncharacterized protein n=1 Tax=Ohtaekwangia kribbensis TaxID=688913 RepID=A0ABW3K0G3_9BACT
MKLKTFKLYDLLISKNIHHLHHANTVPTALTFIQQGGLMSRGAVEKKGLYQTSQKSDWLDKRFDIWTDVFLDTLDLHSHFNRQNHYGPVLFKFSIDFLLKIKSEIWVTKDNPVHWNTRMPQNQKYFRSVLEMKKTWNKYKPEKRIITIRKVLKPILFNYLDEIVLDEPEILLGQIDLYSTARRLLQRTIKSKGVDIKVKVRKCNKHCFCRDNYFEDLSNSQLRTSFLMQLKP